MHACHCSSHCWFCTAAACTRPCRHCVRIACAYVCAATAACAHTCNHGLGVTNPSSLLEAHWAYECRSRFSGLVFCACTTRQPAHPTPAQGLARRYSISEYGNHACTRACQQHHTLAAPVHASSCSTHMRTLCSLSHDQQESMQLRPFRGKSGSMPLLCGCRLWHVARAQAAC